MGRVSNEIELLKQDEVGIEEILVDESQNMRHFPPSKQKVQELKDDILKNGQLQPVVVRAASLNGHKYSLVAGFQRMRALTELAAEGNTIPSVLVRVIDAEDQGAIFANLSENMKRNTLSTIDISYAIGKLVDGETTPVIGEDGEATGEDTVITPGLSLKEIAVQLGIGHGYASELNKMRGLRKPIQKKIHDGEIKGVLARQLVNMTEEEQDKVLAQVEAGEASQNTLAEVAKGKGKKRKYKADRKGKGEAAAGEGGEGEGAPAPVKRGLTSKGAILVLEELTAKDADTDEAVKRILKVFLKFMSGGIGQGALVKQVAKAVLDL